MSGFRLSGVNENYKLFSRNKILDMSESNEINHSNQFGLSRFIPAPIKSEVRKRCGFGCVICGSIIYTYHHFDPPFEDAREHNPLKIVLLCGGCHEKATKKLLSNETIIKAAQNPKCFEKGFSHFMLDVGERFPTVLLGNSSFIGNPTIITAFGKPLFIIEPPEQVGRPFRISAIFFNKKGKKTCEIIKNEWIGFASNWDITTIGNEITIRQDRKEIVFRMHSFPPNKFVVDRLHMFYKGFKIIIKENGQTFTYLPDGTLWFCLNGASLIGNSAVINIE